jgi:hypothetical protein
MSQDARSHAIAAINAANEETGYYIQYRPLTYVKGWPGRSTRPYQLWHVGRGYIAGFAKLSSAEINLRNRLAGEA